MWWALTSSTTPVLLGRLCLARHTTSSPERCEILQFPFHSIAIVNIRRRFEIEQGRTTFTDQDISMVAVLMQEPQPMEPLQHTLALREVARSEWLGVLDLLQDKSDRSATLSDVCQKLRPDTLALYQFVDVALFLDVRNLVAETSDFDDDRAAKYITW